MSQAEISKSEHPGVGKLRVRTPSEEEWQHITLRGASFRRSQGIGYYLLSGLAIAFAIFALFVLTTHPLHGFLLCLLAASTFVYARFIRNDRTAHPRREVLCGEMLCESRRRSAPKQSGGHYHYLEYFAGGRQVYPEAGWLEFWPSGQVVPVELCPLHDASGRSRSAVLLSLPGIDFHSARQVGPAPRPPVLGLILSFFLFTTILLRWVAADTGFTWERLGAAWSAPSDPVLVGSTSEVLARPNAHLQNLRIAHSYFFTGPRSRSALIDLRPEEERQLDELLQRSTATYEPSEEDVAQWLETDPCLATLEAFDGHTGHASYQSSGEVLLNVCTKRAREELARKAQPRATQALNEENATALVAFLRKNYTRVLWVQHEDDTVAVTEMRNIEGYIGEYGDLRIWERNDAKEVAAYGASYVGGFLAFLIWQFARLRRYYSLSRQWSARVRSQKEAS